MFQPASGKIVRQSPFRPAAIASAPRLQPPKRGDPGRIMLDFVQQAISGVALGCVYGLIALGFVLIYKATEVVNFAQGELTMLGAFLSFTFINTLGLNYWLAFVLCVVCMAIAGALIERLVVR